MALVSPSRPRCLSANRPYNRVTDQWSATPSYSRLERLERLEKTYKGDRRMKKDKKAQEHERPTLEGKFCSDYLLLDIFLFFSHFPLIQIARLQIRLQDHKFIYKIANSLQDRKFICKIANLQT